ncbi:sulfur carrier protein ThiS [Pontibacillus salicampi]|uniref:Sulfur carrier protein ThiS n=1 Tax=Pontibacillus salicampi TaxID=1449801 RepID=A0ABV6LPR5_9BACI
MTIQVNGKNVELPYNIETITHLLTFYALEDKPVIVEWNKAIIPKEQYATAAIQHGDEFELVHFVGGG